MTMVGTANGNQWEAARTALRREQEREAAINARHAQAQADGTMTKELEQEWSDSIDPLVAAEWALFTIPAPDLAAVGWKLTMLADKGLVDEDIGKRLIGDVSLLLAREA